ncbi:MAG: molecular chaperone TorD [bacterium]|nr:molecular chaperone TorD [bacterium]
MDTGKRGRINITIEQCRAESYRLLAACFYPPEDSWLNEENFFKSLDEVLQPICQDAAGFVDQMERAAEHDGAQELAVEYAKLFVGPYELLAPPYGSVYLDRQKRVMGDSTMTVKNMYREYGLQLADDFNEIPDHIAAELEFMYYLIYKEIEKLQQSGNGNASTFVHAQKRLIHSFLGEFVFLLCKKIQEETISTFYKALADCVSTFVRSDYNAFQEEKNTDSKE